MRIIIAGSRDFDDYELLTNECNKIFCQLASEGYIPLDINTSIKEMEIVSGHANGADKLGEMFAKEYGIGIKYFIPNWELFGKKAGFIRNAEMSSYAKQDAKLGVLIAFSINNSKGTRDMIKLATEQGLRVFVIKVASEEMTS